jgi:rod shape-determining protein MreC
VLDCGTGKCEVEQIQNEEKVDKNEWFYTSGEDRIFPKGFPVGTVLSSEPGQGMRDVWLNLSGAPGGVEEVLVVLHGVHQAIPAAAPEGEDTAAMLPPPDNDAAGKPAVKPQTEADKVLHHYEGLGKDEGHVYGALGSNMPNFNPKPAPKPSAAPTDAANAGASSGQPAAAGPKSETPAPAGPTILGAPKTTTANPAGGSFPVPKPPVSEPPNTDRAPDGENPVLPLGAPRRKPGTDTTATRQPPLQP